MIVVVRPTGQYVLQYRLLQFSPVLYCTKTSCKNSVRFDHSASCHIRLLQKVIQRTASKKNWAILKATMLALNARFCRSGLTKAGTALVARTLPVVPVAGASFFSSIPGFPAPPCTPVPWRAPTSQPSSIIDIRVPTTLNKINWQNPSAPIPLGWIDEEVETLVMGNRNARVPRKANHGARPCSRVRRRWMRRRFGAWRRS